MDVTEPVVTGRLMRFKYHWFYPGLLYPTMTSAINIPPLFLSVRRRTVGLLYRMHLFGNRDPPFSIKGRLSYEGDNYFTAQSEENMEIHREALRLGEPSAVQICLLYGASCTKPLLVAVRIHSGFEGRCLPIDLDVDDYVDRPKITNGDVVRMNQGYKELRILGEDHRYTVVSSEGVPVPLRASRYLAKQRLVRDSIGSSGWEDTIAFDLGVYGGNILIARSDSNGAVVDAKRVDVQWANSNLRPPGLRPLANFARSADRHWAIADRLLRTRLRHVLSRFIPQDKLQSFLELLNTVDGAIVGLTALEMILFHETRNTPLNSRYLDLLLPHNGNSMTVAVQFFRTIGYSNFHVVDVPPVSATGRHTNLVARALGDGPRQADGTRTGVRLFSSRGGPFASLFEVASTVLVNAVTPDGIYCFYKDLTTSGRGLANPQANAINGVQVATNNDEWGDMCQSYCPRLRRKTLDDEGTLVYRWRVPLGSAYSVENVLLCLAIALFQMSYIILQAYQLICRALQELRISMAGAPARCGSSTRFLSGSQRMYLSLFIGAISFLVPGTVIELTMLAFWKRSMKGQLNQLVEDDFVGISDSIIRTHQNDVNAGILSAVRYCTLFGANCQKPIRVALLVHSRFEMKCRPYDLHVEAYLDRADLQHSSAVALNDTFRFVQANGTEYVVINEVVSAPLNLIVSRIQPTQSQNSLGNVLVVKVVDGKAVDFADGDSVPAEVFYQSV
ncbi:hypothetical protein BKA70DRAFT_1233816 [Coprinopsis sp. MPI-PUGE-AT-0042]|nr:hypothetical protein BKA70DRAFT_1233816 [Coprinopsis sp. MPI-PUGE-AT-0042]